MHTSMNNDKTLTLMSLELFAYKNKNVENDTNAYEKLIPLTPWECSPQS